MSRLPAEVRLVLIADVAFAGADRVVSLVDRALPPSCDGRVLVIERDKRTVSEQVDTQRLGRLQEFRSMTRQRGAFFAVNHRVDLALASNADGVHLPESGLPASVVRAIAPNLWIGRSCHDAPGLQRAEDEKLDWAFLSPISAPISKPPSLPTIGIQGFADQTSACMIPIFALGGITAAHIKPLMNVGARGVAVIGHVLGAQDPQRALSKLLGDC